MRVAGLRLQTAVARLLVDVLEGAGYAETASKIADAITRQITVEAPLTRADYEAILEALNRNCPSTLYDVRRVLLEDQRYIRRVTGG
jgi:hypothetical protein